MSRPREIWPPRACRPTRKFEDNVQFTCEQSDVRCNCLLAFPPIPIQNFFQKLAIHRLFEISLMSARGSETPCPKNKLGFGSIGYLTLNKESSLRPVNLVCSTLSSANLTSYLASQAFSELDFLCPFPIRLNSVHALFFSDPHDIFHIQERIFPLPWHG